MANILALSPEITVLSGFDEVCVAGLSMGAQGAVGSTYNVMPATFSLLYQRAQAAIGRRRGRCNRRRTGSFGRLLSGPMVAGLKAILTEWGIPCGAPRRPLPPLSPAETREYLAA